MTISEIKKSFPYNKTETIKLVSFKYDYPGFDTIKLESAPYEPEIPKTNGQIDLSKMFEVKTLDNDAEEELLHLLMNYDDQDTNDIAMCYEPRNGIVFFDNGERVIGYIEVCFECLQYKKEPTSITVSTLYPHEFKALQEFFKKAGIVYGTVDDRH